MEAVYLAVGTCIGISILLIGLSIPMYLGKIKRNNWYGFRTTKTLSSDEIWYPANRESAFYFMIAGVFTFIGGVAIFFLRTILPPETLVIVMIAVASLSLIGAVIKSFMFLSKITKGN